jgi:DNA polymerase III subunit beta
MKITIEQSALLRGLQHVQSVVERRNTIPILANLLLEAQDNRLGLTATDMDIAIVERVAADVARQGSITAPAHLLFDIARKLPEGAQIELSTDAAKSDRLTVRAGRARFQLQTLPVEDFPMMPAGALPYSFSLSAADWRALIDRTRFAISTEETRYYLNGIYLHVDTAAKTKVMRAVATDGHRLARVELPMPEGAAGMPGVIVPRKTIAELRKLLDASSAAVAVALSDTRIRLAFDDAVLTSKLIDGTFPDYHRVIPNANDKVMEVECKAFSAAVDRVATVATERSRAVKFSVSTGTLNISATSTEGGTAADEIEARYSGVPLEIGFNSRYLLDITQQVGGEGLRFSFADAQSPTLVQDVSDPSALYVLMPMRV